MELVPCFHPVSASCVIFPNCKLRQVLSTATNAFLSALDRHTLADLVHARPPLRKLLSIAPETKLSGKAKARIGRGRSRVDKVRTNPPV